MVGENDPQPREGTAAQVRRNFEQSPNALSVYSDYAQIIGTDNEVILQFYETIPGIPGPGGASEMVTTSLKATIVVSLAHAANIGRLILSSIPANQKQGNTE